MSGLLATLPVHLACQLISPEDSGHRNLTFGKDTSLPNYKVDLPQGYTPFPDVGRAYKFWTNKLPWNVARKQCIAEGASLAIVDSFKKIGYIVGLTEQKWGGHTGIHRLFDGTEWSDIKTGQSLGFIPWKEDADIKAGTGQCVAMWFDGSGVGPWNCDTPLPAICEIPLFQGFESGQQPPRNLHISIASS